MTAFLLTLNALICVALILLILLQRNDPNAGGMFGGTGGAGGPAIRNPLATPTAYLAGAFMLLSLVIAFTTKGGGTHHSVVVEGDHAAETAEPDANSTVLIPVSSNITPTEVTPTTPTEAQ